MEIRGERVILKVTEQEDLNNIMALWNNGEVMTWVGFPDGLNITMEELEDWFNYIENSELAYHYVVLDINRQFCGEVFYKKNPEYKRAGLDIKFLPEAQGKGWLQRL